VKGDRNRRHGREKMATTSKGSGGKTHLVRLSEAQVGVEKEREIKRIQETWVVFCERCKKRDRDKGHAPLLRNVKGK